MLFASVLGGCGSSATDGPTTVAPLDVTNDGGASSPVKPDASPGGLSDASVVDGGDTGVDGGGHDDPFDPLACGGTPLKGSELLARIGTKARELGSTFVRYRSRGCTAKGVGCGPFRETDRWVERIDAAGQHVNDRAAAGVAVYPWPNPATAGWVYLGGPNYPTSPVITSSAYDNTSCGVDESGVVTCGKYTIVFAGSAVPGELRFRFANAPLRLRGKITESCLQLFASGGGAPVGSWVTLVGPWADEEVAVLHRFSPHL